MSAVYFKVAPQNFDATVFDTDDLSITRGSSLVLLHMPALLRARLDAVFADRVRLDVLSDAASELVFGVEGLAGGDEGGLTIEPAKTLSVPKTVRKQAWKKALKAAAAALPDGAGDAVVLQATEAMLSGLGEKRPDIAPEAAASQVLMVKRVPAGGGAPPVDASILDEISREIDAYLGAPRPVPEPGKTGHTLEAPFGLFQFAVARVSVDPHETLDRIFARLDTALRLQRYRRLSCARPPRPVPIGTGEDVVCGYTRTMPALADPSQWILKTPTSRSARDRREYGRIMKPVFYREVLHHASALDGGGAGDAAETALRKRIAAGQALVQPGGPIESFAQDFSEIVAKPPDDVSLSVRSSLAVVALDGNGFGALRGKALSAGDAAYRRFSDRLDLLKAAMMAELLQALASKPGYLLDGSARFETLLWGGDEFAFVCPGWMGWRFLTSVLDAVSGWTTPEGQPLTLACGVVFAPYKSPIRDIRDAVEALQSAAKADRGATSVQAIAYESIDRVHYQPEGFRRDWLGGEVPPGAFSISPETVAQAPARVAEFYRRHGRTALHGWYFRQKDLLGRPADKGVEAALAWLKQDAHRIGTGEDGSSILDVLPAFDPTYPLLPLAQVALLADYIAAEGVEYP